MLANVDRYKNPNSTGDAAGMIEREFENRTSLIVDPPDGRIPPLTSEAQQRRAAPSLPAGPEDLPDALRCLTYGVPRLGLANTSAAGPLGFYQIVQSPGFMVLFLEAIHEVRIIPIGSYSAGKHLPQHIRQWSGDSRGRWDGNTLVVDTRNFSPRTNFQGAAERLHVTERFTRIAPDALQYEITMDDPTTWTKPWTALLRLKARKDQLYEYACHEGNYHVMHGMLVGARVQEREAEGAASRR